MAQATRPVKAYNGQSVWTAGVPTIADWNADIDQLFNAYNTHDLATTGVHGVGSGTIAKIGDAIPSYTVAGLPAAGTAGRLARVTDGIRGIWKDTGTAWVSLTGHADVRDFGAVGDGSTDDSTAIQAAITAAAVNTNPVYLPRPASSYYMGTTGLTIGSGLTVYGDGSGSTTLTWSASFTGSAITVTGNYNTLRGFGVWAPKKASAPTSTLIGIDLQGPINELIDVRTDQTSAGNNSPWYYGVKVTGIQNSILFSHIYAYHTGIWSSGASNIIVDGSEVIAQINAGIRAASASSTKLVNNDIEANGGSGAYGILLEASNEVAGATISGNYLEGWTNTGVYLGGTGSAGINGVHIHGNTINCALATNGVRAEYTKGLVIKGNYIAASANAISLVTSNLDFEIEPNYFASGSMSISGTQRALSAYKTRYKALGTALVAGDIALSAGWGTTASVSAISGTDQRFRFTVTSTGTGQGANPTATLTFKDGTWTAAPYAVVSRNGGDQAAVLPTWSTTATTLVITFPGTPLAGQTYTFEAVVLG